MGRTRRRLWGIVLAAGMLGALLVTAGPASATFPGQISNLHAVQYGDGTPGIWRFDLDENGDEGGLRCGDAGSGLALETNSRIWAGMTYWGEGVLFTCIQESGSRSIYFVSSDFGSSHEVTFFDGDHTNPAVSADGDRLLYSSASDPEGERSICALELNEGGAAQPTCFDNPNLDGDSWAPVWNPFDDAQFAFVSTSDGDADIYMYDLRTNEAGPLTENSVNDFGPDFHPTEERIVYSSNVSGMDQLFWMNVSDREPVQLTTDSNHNYEPVYSPDGQQIAFTKQGTAPGSESEIYTMPAEGGAATPVGSTGGFYDHAEWFQAGEDDGGCEPNCEVPYIQRLFMDFKLSKHLKVSGRLLDDDEFEDDCISGQAVKVQRRKAGRWVTVKTAVTASDGFFRTSLPDKPGTYRAKVKENEVGEEGFPVTCAMSKSVTKKHNH